MPAPIDDPFPPTNWPLIEQAARGPDPRPALETLLRSYWPCMYAHVRRRGHGRVEAEDLVQGFFADLLARDALRGVSPDGGRFRAFLIACCDHHLANHHARRKALKRGGGTPPAELDRAAEPCDPVTPDRQAERRWAEQLLARALDRLLADDGQPGDRGRRLRAVLTADPTAPTTAELAAEFGLSEGGVRMLLFRYRRRLKRYILDEAGASHPVEPSAVPEPVRDLFAAFSD